MHIFTATSMRDLIYFLPQYIKSRFFAVNYGKSLIFEHKTYAYLFLNTSDYNCK
jgi:hypothetical protein